MADIGQEALRMMVQRVDCWRIYLNVEARENDREVM